MRVQKAQIKNFRLLKDIELSFEDTTTVIVGRNNSGKTSLAEIFRRFFESKSFNIVDFNLNAIDEFKSGNQAFIEGRSFEEVRAIIPSIDLILTVDYEDSQDDLSLISEFIIDFDADTTKAIIKLSFEIKHGQIESLYEGLSNDDENFCTILEERIPQLFHIVATAIDPTDLTNVKDVDYKSIFNLLKVDFINAQRGLDDNTANERDVLGKILSNLFKTSSLESAPEDMKTYYDQIEETIRQIQSDVNTELTEKIGNFLPALSLFGYPGLSDPNISTVTTFNAQSILDGHTKIVYKGNGAFILPESHNGLGSRNLIYILFQLYTYFRNLQAQPVMSSGHLIFIEEPEAHLHPQMQEVFIKQINDIVVKFKELNGDQKWPVQFLVSTHSTHIANKAGFDCIRYFFTKPEDKKTTVRDLKNEFKTDENKEDRDFIHKYLTLTKCDLFFADKAILIEGAAERIMMPQMLARIDQNCGTHLSRQYVTFVEIGGAYAHHFYKFLDFLELKALVITDIDSVKSMTKNGRTSRCACPVSQGEFTSNSGIKRWFDINPEESLADIKNKSTAQKIIRKRRIAYQIPEMSNTIPCGRSFEDAFILANKVLFGISGRGRSLEKKAYNKASKYSDNKTDFAIEHAISNNSWSVPRYIKEGLCWLAEDN